MLFSTIGQGWVFLWMMAAGALIGAWFCLLDGLRGLMQAGFWLNLILDIIFGLGAAVIFALGLISANYGRTRLFAVLGALMGFSLFLLGFKPPVRSLGRGLRRLGAGIKQLRWIKILFR